MIRNLLNRIFKNFSFKLLDFCRWKRVLETADLIKNNTNCPDVSGLCIWLISPQFWRKIEWRPNSIFFLFNLLLFLHLIISQLMFFSLRFNTAALIVFQQTHIIILAKKLFIIKFISDHVKRIVFNIFYIALNIFIFFRFFLLFCIYFFFFLKVIKRWSFFRKFDCTTQISYFANAFLNHENI